MRLASELAWEAFRSGSFPVATFASVLPMAVLLAFNPTGDTSDHYRLNSSTAFGLAMAIVDNNSWPKRDLDLTCAIEHVAGR